MKGSYLSGRSDGYESIDFFSAPKKLFDAFLNRLIVLSQANGAAS